MVLGDGTQGGPDRRAVTGLFRRGTRQHHPHLRQDAEPRRSP